MSDGENSPGLEFNRFLDELMQLKLELETPKEEAAPMAQRQEKNEMMIPDRNLEVVDQRQQDEIEEPPKIGSTLTPGLNQEVRRQEEHQCEKSPDELRRQQSSDREDMMACLEQLGAAFNARLQLAEYKGPVPVQRASSYQESMNQLEPALATKHDQVTGEFPADAYQADVEKHIKEFMEAAIKLQRYVMGLQLPSEPQPTNAETLRKDNIAAMEEELMIKLNELMQKEARQITKWMKELHDHLEKLEAARDKV